MNWTLLFELSGIIFWILIIGVIGIQLYFDFSARYFLWNNKRKWKKHYKKTFGNENTKTKF